MWWIFWPKFHYSSCDTIVTCSTIPTSSFSRSPAQLIFLPWLNLVMKYSCTQRSKNHIMCSFQRQHQLFDSSSILSMDKFILVDSEWASSFKMASSHRSEGACRARAADKMRSTEPWSMVSSLTLMTSRFTLALKSMNILSMAGCWPNEAP